MLEADPRMPNGTENSLLFLALKAQVVKVLASKGFVEVNQNDSDYLINAARAKVLNMMISKGIIKEPEGVVVPGQDIPSLQELIQTAIANGCTRREMESALAGLPVTICLYYKVRFFNGPSGYTLNAQTQNFGPFQNLTGEIVPHVNTTAASIIGLLAWDTSEVLLTGGRFVLKPNGLLDIKGGQQTWAWSVLGVMINSSGDIQRDFPYLLAAIKPYIGTSTGKMIEVRLTSDDKRVIEINHILDGN